MKAIALIGLFFLVACVAPQVVVDPHIDVVSHDDNERIAREWVLSMQLFNEDEPFDLELVRKEDNVYTFEYRIPDERRGFVVPVRVVEGVASLHSDIVSLGELEVRQ